MVAMKIFFLVLSATFMLYCDATSVKLTYYWQVRENDFKLGRHATLATCDGRPLARVSKKFADQIAIEGSGFLRNGKTLLNLGQCVGAGNPCKPRKGLKYRCFEKGQFPVGNRDNPLVPLVSVASNGFDFGTTGIIREFVGKKTPMGDTHDGCVRIEDSCSTCEESTQFDFYAYTKRNADYFEKNWRGSNQRVEFTPVNCTPKKYRV